MIPGGGGDDAIRDAFALLRAAVTDTRALAVVRANLADPGTTAVVLALLTIAHMDVPDDDYLAGLAEWQQQILP